MSSTNSSPASGLPLTVKILIGALGTAVVFLFVMVLLLAATRGNAAPAEVVTGSPTPEPSATPPASATPVPGQLQITASPNTIAAGDAFTVFGTNWTPKDKVTIFLRDPAKPTDPILPIGTGEVKADGTLVATVNYPTEARWAELKQVDVIVQSSGNGAYQATTVTVQPAPATPTSTATPIPPTTTATNTPSPISPTPTRTRVPATPTPTRTATPQGITDWRGEYYANTGLSGVPMLIRNDVDVNFNWQNGGPGNLPADNFSARWTRQLWFPNTQTYRFVLRADDGVRLWIDGALMIDEWHWAAPDAFTKDVPLSSGWHAFRIEYYEATGDAFVQFRVENPPAVTITDWKGEYFANMTLNGAPALTRNDVSVNFNWGNGAPANGLPADGFSARWTRTLNFDDADYTFRLQSDDGVRLYLDNVKVRDEWHNSDGQTYENTVHLTAGKHTVKIEYYENTGGSLVNFTMQKVVDFTRWKGEYFANDKLAGYPAVVRNDDKVDFDWGDGSPDQLIPADHFSVRWTRSLNLDAGQYQFDLLVDDGVRFWVDGTLVVDKWQASSPTPYSVKLNLAQGTHAFKIEYVEYTGQARISWTRTYLGGIVTPTSTPTKTATPTVTATATGQPGLLIRGHVRLNNSGGPGLAGVAIYRAFASYAAVQVATTDANGYYQAAFQGIPGDESVTVSAQLNGYVFDPAQVNWRHYYGYEERALDFVATTPTQTPTITPTPTATATPTATPTATSTMTTTVPTTEWRGEYFNNATLAGTPVLVRADAAIDFNWANQPPAEGLPADRFSVRWTRAINTDQNVYRFTVQADDGVRVAIDNNWLYNQTGAAAPDPHEFDVNLTPGRHVIVVDYFEDTGPARIRFDYGLAAQVNDD